ncbi:MULTISPECIES: ATP-binding protein [unclassified Pseudoxanthomonas]|uniref:sensor histidine kinase n=1 Tax=unclassified Pseudoxanthomonas TaxID=2645906 RepID=UPI0008F41AA0|nr:MULTISPECIES: ATP-binding protein [unclassified Pseudoxanthomonas]PPJ41337.1 HAMP domain-containing protein [Pseudoxanthomonas sp. KAs_5_3]SFV30580.1 two-component system, OmpR family, sensor kinase [Pseudoxanthomonas sp. YR558]
MSARLRRMPLFARTFLLLLAALAVAYAIGMAVLLYRPPVDGIAFSELTALLSSRMPATGPDLKVYDAEQPPIPDPARYRASPFVRDLLAQWLGSDAQHVHFYHLQGPQPFSPAQRAPGGPPPMAGAGMQAPPMDGPTRPPEDAGNPAAQRFPLAWRPDAPLRGDFVAAFRQTDGRWRVVENTRNRTSFMIRLATLFLAGMLALLPLAWWFSRALAAPIRQFTRAADRMGRESGAPALPLTGPSEFASAAAAFNAMQARLDRLLQERSEMAGAIAHDLRTPLARLAFRLDALPDESRDKASADIAEMSQMIDATLAFIHDQNRRPLREPLDLRLLVAGVADSLRDTGHDVHVEPGAPAPMKGDPLSLRRMVGNLVDNALKYGHRARITLSPEGQGYRLCVDDEGPGIDPAQTEQLFMAFVRGEASRNRSTGGIGLGLASVKHTVLAHGGEVQLSNRNEGGLRASVYLPRGAE